MRVLIADDEELARESLRRPDVVFPDIEMPGLNGFEVLQMLAEAPLVIFATAYDEYAVRAFETDAIDYILKPVEPVRLERAIARVRERLAGGGQAAEAARQHASKHAGPLRRLAAKRGNRFVIVPLKEIARVAIEDKLVFAYAEKERYLVERTISDLETLLEPAGFVRISRGELVNVEMLRELIPWFSGTWRVRLAGGGEHDVSRERAKKLRESMGVI